MIPILKALFIIQEESNLRRSPKLGRGYRKAYRVNPYNPLSYLFILMVFTITMICYGVVGMWKELDFRSNPFKWN